jgi:hypothetical protein
MQRIVTISRTQGKRRKAKGGSNIPPAGVCMKGPIGSRSKAMAELIRKLVAKRQANIEYVETYCPSYRTRVRRMEECASSMSLDAFINLMTGLRCEVIVVPMGGSGYKNYYRLNDFPDNEGNVLKIPAEIKKGHRKRRTGV